MSLQNKLYRIIGRHAYKICFASSVLVVALDYWENQSRTSSKIASKTMTRNMEASVSSSLFKTPAELWNSYDEKIKSDPLDIEWGPQWEEDGVIIKNLRYSLGKLSGTAIDATPRIAAYFAHPVSGSQLPGLVQIHGGGQKAEIDLAKYWAKEGFACISINWGGVELKEGHLNTNWDGLAAGFLSDIPRKVYHGIDPTKSESTSTLFAEVHPLNNGFMLNSYAARRALTFLETMPMVDGAHLGLSGHSMGGQTTVLSATDSRVKSITPGCGGVGHEKLADLSAEDQTWNVQAYWPYIIAPTLFLVPTNDFNAHFDDVIENLKYQNHLVQQRLAILPHYNHRYGREMYASKVLWHKANLMGEFRYPLTPKTKLDLNQADKIPEFTVTPDSTRKTIVYSVEIYYGYGGDIPEDRFFRKADAVNIGNTWVAKCPVYDLSRPLYVFALAHHTIGYMLPLPLGHKESMSFVVASKVDIIPPGVLVEAGVIATEKQNLLIEDFSYGNNGDFISNNKDWYGTESPYEIFTWKLADPAWHGPAGSDLLIDVTSVKKGCGLTVSLTAGFYNETFQATTLLQETGPQQIRLKPNQFKSKDDTNDALLSWEDMNNLGLMDLGLIDSNVPKWDENFKYDKVQWDFDN